MSPVYLHAFFNEDNTLQIQADADAFIVRGLVALVTIIYSGKTANEILTIDINKVFQTLGLEKSLSPNRRNGFYAMVRVIVELANNHSD